MTEVLSKAEFLFEKRKQFVPNAIGIFNPSTASSAKGSLITDADGKEMIDFAGGIGVVNAGHCPSSVVEAIAKQAATMIHCSFNIATYSLYMQLAEKLAGLFLTGNRQKSCSRIPVQKVLKTLLKLPDRPLEERQSFVMEALFMEEQ